jgi:DNA processing protein
MLIYWIWLATRQGMTAWEKQVALAYFGSPEDCYFAKEAAYKNIEDLSKNAVEALCDKDIQEAETILAACARKKIHILTWQDARYPVALKNISDPPMILYYRGTMPEFNSNPFIGVVGTRKASAYGLKLAENISKQVARCGGIVVSGMAEGIDAMATRGALSEGKMVVGVLGCGVDVVYPRCNRELFLKMERNGCLISEYPPETAPNKWNFPKRNRIISGLSCGVLVVEAPMKSGALITARQALDQGRDVFVTPGNVGVASCEGSNALLRDGAILVTTGWDIVSEYVHRYPDKIRETANTNDKKHIDKVAPQPYIDQETNVTGENSPEEAILACLDGGEQIIDAIIEKTGLSSGTVLAALTLLEVTGAVVTRPGGWVAKNL